MSRILVKQLPREANESTLRKLFSEYGNITDVIVKKTKDGRPRCFGFVGFDNEESATKAIADRDRTYIGPKQIRVEKALPPKDKGLARPWSSLSKGSSAYDRLHGKPEDEDKSISEKKLNAIEQMKSEIKLKGDEDTLDEFFQMKRASGTIGSWKNEENKDNMEGEDDYTRNLENNSPNNEGIIKNKTGHASDDEDDISGDYSIDSDDAPVEIPIFKSSDKIGTTRAEQVENFLKTEKLPFDNGRIVIWNIPKTCLEEDIENVCSRSGTITDIHYPIDRITGEHKNFCFVEFALSEQAKQAAEALDKTIFKGCMIRVGPAESKNNNEDGDTEEDRMHRAVTYKQKKMEKLREEATQATMTWNTTFLRSDTAANIAAERLNVTKEEFLEADENAAVRLTIAEAQVVQDMKDLFKSWGVSPKALQGNNKYDETMAKMKRSRVIIVAKNIPSDVEEEDLRRIFEHSARINKILYPKIISKNGTPIHSGFALIKFVDSQEARKAFTYAAFRKLGAARAPLYLEWAPIAEDSSLNEEKKKEENVKNPEGSALQTKDKSKENEDLAKEITTNDVQELGNPLENIKGVTTASSCIYIKNLPFRLDDTGLRHVILQSGCARANEILSISVAKNSKTGKSRGFGFAQLSSPQVAMKGVEALNHYMVEGHELEAKISEHANISKVDVPSSDIIPNEAEERRKLMVRNVPFEAEQRQLKTLFDTYGQVKNLRLPKKFDGTSRGFCFVEYTNHDDAQRALQALGSVHFLGRHLVIEWADGSSSSGGGYDDHAHQNKRSPK